MSPSHRYAVRLTWTGASAGPIESYESYSRRYLIEAEGKPSLQGSADAHFRGDAALYNPEDLLVAALSACHMLTYLALCARAGIAVRSYEDAAEGTMVLTRGGGGHFTEVILHPQVRVVRESDLNQAKALHAVAHEQCFIASSVNFAVRNEPAVSAATP